jgi:2-polyprenyl-3-methyl-5-hydroxy-6-metoxy-1,4-benzoquinol methylase
LHCDQPQPDESIIGEAVSVRGWAHALGGIESVVVVVNDEMQLSAMLGSARPDVADALDDASAAQPGWQLSISIADVVPGANVLRIVAHAQDGATAELRRAFMWRDYAEGETPYDQIDLSGERYDPRYPHANSVAVEHRARYHLATSLANGVRVLDAGCGLGYGATTMAQAGAKTVDAIDANHGVIEVAARKNPAGVRFRVGDVKHLPYADASFDLVVCFEVLEHLVEHDELLAEFKRVLRPEGRLLISTPNKGIYPSGNPWHLRELTKAQFDAVLRAHFANVRVLGQQLHLATLLASSDVQQAAGPSQMLDADVLKLSGTTAGGEMYSVAIASDGELPPTPSVIALGDPRDELVDATIGSWTERALQAEAEAGMLRTRLATYRHQGFTPADSMSAPVPPPPAAQTQAELQNELRHPTPWMYDWDLGVLGRVDVSVELPSIHKTRLELLAPAVTDVIEKVGPGATVLDLACSEGWFAHQMLELGAARVVGIDIRELNIRRATLVRDHLGIAPDRMQFHQADIFALPELDQFDVVLMLGLVYHLENPVGAMRIARALTRELCVVESQLTEQRSPIMAGNGSSQIHFAREESFAAWFEEDQADNLLASHGGILSLIPNEAALLAMGRVAGFTDVVSPAAAPSHNPQYVRRERIVMLARAGGLSIDQARQSA